MSVRLEVFDLGECIVTDISGRTHWLRDGVAFATQFFEGGVVHLGYRPVVTADSRLGLRVERAEIDRLVAGGIARPRTLDSAETNATVVEPAERAAKDSKLEPRKQ